MTAVLDAFALVALALDEPAAAEVEATIRRGDCGVSAVNLAEAIDQLGRVHGGAEAALRGAFAPVLGAAVIVVPARRGRRLRAAELRRRHCRRREAELSLADCIALAIVRPGDRLVTADPALARAARGEAFDVLALPDSAGRRP